MRLRLILLIVLAFATHAHAAKLYKWVDRDGHVTYQDRPPPSDAGNRVEEKRFGVGGNVYDSSKNKAAAMFPVVLYTTPKCTPCDAARAYLERRGVPFTEKNVQGDAGAQQELEKRAGELTVPTITVGNRIMRGYLESLLEGELDEAGYPKTGTGTESAQDDATDDEAAPAPYEDDFGDEERFDS